jgi:hypothetical protein
MGLIWTFKYPRNRVKEKLWDHEIIETWKGIKLVIKIPELNILNSAADHFPFKTPLNL